MNKLAALCQYATWDEEDVGRALWMAASSTAESGLGLAGRQFTAITVFLASAPSFETRVGADRVEYRIYVHVDPIKRGKFFDRGLAGRAYSAQTLSPALAGLFDLNGDTRLTADSVDVQCQADRSAWC